MLRLSLTRRHVAPASSDENRPPFSCSMSAYTRFESAPDTETPIRPIVPAGKPGLRVISVQVSPPSVDLNKPLPGPPLDIWYSTRYASHNAANITDGFLRSMVMSTAPVFALRNNFRCQVLPPSVDLKTPRSSLSAPYLPKDATNTMSGFVGWIRILEIACEPAKPTCVHVLPASVDL